VRVATESRGATSRASADPDSRARTHLANERTFLAWLRTGLSLVAVGLAVASFLPLDLVPGFPLVRVFATLLVLAGTAVVLFGADRYRRARETIETGSFVPGTTPILAIAIVVALLGVVAVSMVLLLR
jgi:putative membrane protein